MVHKGTSSSYRSVDCIGLWSYLFNSLSSKRFCGAVYIVIYFGYIFFTFWWAEPGGIDPWPCWLIIVLRCFDTVGWVIWPIKSSPKWPIMCQVGRYTLLYRYMLIMSCCNYITLLPWLPACPLSLFRVARHSLRDICKEVWCAAVKTHRCYFCDMRYGENWQGLSGFTDASVVATTFPVTSLSVPWWLMPTVSLPSVRAL